MRYKNNLPIIALAITCVVLAVTSLAALRHTGVLQQTLKVKQDEFAAKLAEYKKNIEQLQETIDQKVKALADADNRLADFGRQIDAVKKDRAELEEQQRMLNEANEALKQQLGKFNNASLESLITETLEKEANRDIRRVLADALAKVELMRAGKVVDLEPIVVTKADTAAKAPAAGPASFTIVAIDRKNSLIAIDGGRKDDIGVGDRLSIIKNGSRIAAAAVIVVRHRVASALINTIAPNHSLNEIKEGDRIIVAAQ